MAETIQKRVGRTRQSIDLLALGVLRPLRAGETPYMRGSDEEAGYIAQRQTLINDIIRNIFRTDTTSVSYPNNTKKAFQVQCHLGTIFVEAGVMGSVGLAMFPYMTSITFFNQNGTVFRHYDAAGNINITA